MKFNRYCFGILAGTLMLGQPAYAANVKADAFIYNFTQIGSFMVPAGSLIPTSPGGLYLNDGFRVWTVGQPATVCFHAPVKVPQRATIIGIRAWYLRPTANDKLSVVLRRVKLNPSLGLEHIANASGEQAPIATSYKDVIYNIPGAQQKVNNQTHGFLLFVCVAGNAQFYGAAVLYFYTAAGD